MNLYIDTNIFLTFYHLTDDDLDELKKLAILIENKQIKLLLPEQTRNEFVRNRDKSIYDAISSLKEQKISSRFPQVSKGYEEFQLLKEAIKAFEKHKNTLISKIEKDAKTYLLNADEVIQRIFNSSHKINLSLELIDRAKVRYDLGNPPGKGKSYGDAVNWESLLFKVKEKEDLFLISDDGDFTSELDKKELNSFLKDEWENVKGSTIHFYKTLSDFFKTNFPDIKLSDELEKEILIKDLANAGTFASAKTKLAKLTKYSEFTNQQLNDIVEIAITNNQLYWIHSDVGVGDVLNNLIKDKEDKIDSTLLKEFSKVYRPYIPDEVNEEDFPF